MNKLYDGIAVGVMVLLAAFGWAGLILYVIGFFLGVNLLENL